MSPRSPFEWHVRCVCGHERQEHMHMHTDGPSPCRHRSTDAAGDVDECPCEVFAVVPALRSDDISRATAIVSAVQGGLMTATVGRALVATLSANTSAARAHFQRLQEALGQVAPQAPQMGIEDIPEPPPRPLVAPNWRERVVCNHPKETRPSTCTCPLDCGCRHRMCHVSDEPHGGDNPLCRCGHRLEYHRPDMDGSGECGHGWQMIPRTNGREKWERLTEKTFSCRCNSFHAASDPKLKPQPQVSVCANQACGHPKMNHKPNGGGCLVSVARIGATDQHWCTCDAWQDPTPQAPTRAILIRD